MKSIFLLIVTVFFYNTIFAQKFSVNHNNVLNNSCLEKTIKSNKSFRITHSASSTIVTGMTVSCNNNQLYHYENSYYLAYDLKNDFNLNGDWIVDSVKVAIEKALSGDASGQPLIVKAHVMSEYNHRTIIRDSLSLLVSDTVTVSDSESGTLKNIDFSPGYVVTEGKVLVMEFLLPDGQENNNLLFLGSNNDRISDSTYIRAPHCGVDEPLNVSEILYPDMMLIADIYGQYASPNPQIQSFTVEGQLVNTEIKNEPDYTVKVVMPADTVLNALSPTIQIPAGFQITPASGETVDFSQGPVTYTVDNNFLKTSQSWEVSVVNAGPDIIGANLSELYGDVVIDGSPNYTVTIPVLEGTNLTDLAPDIFVYEGFTVNPESGTSQDFSSGSVSYTVSHETLPLTQDWQVSVVEVPVGTDVGNIEKTDIKIYPNPAKSRFFIKCDNFIKADLFDFTGKKVLETYKKETDISKLSDGIFFLKLYSDKKSVTKKIIIIH